MKRCGICKTEQPESEFYRAKKTGYLSSRCKECYRRKYREIVAHDPERRREQWRRAAAKRDTRAYWRKFRYGITEADYQAMVERQEGKCAICFTEEKKLHIDHDHNTGIIRGLLCSNCNRGIGYLGDSAERLESAARYLRRCLVTAKAA